MNKTALKNFAISARKELIEKVKAKAFRIGITEESIKKAQFESSDAVYIDGKQLSATEKKQREKLVSRIKEIGYKQVVEEVAYTWFNRFTALRFMEVNNYLPTKVRVLSSTNSDSTEPDIIKEALNIDLEVDKEFVYDLKLNNKMEELFKYLIIKQCNSLSVVLPFMFEIIDDYNEILFPEGLLSKDSFLREMTDVSIIPTSDWEQVEIIGWLYQFYISERKDQVFADLKKNIKISKDNIPAATQLFTPHWIVKYMVENSLGRMWIESSPKSSLKFDWKYYLDEAEQENTTKTELENLSYKNIEPENITFLDPCCGSGHILVYAFDVLFDMYVDRGYTVHDIPKLILERNLFGLDIDHRAAQLASFAVMMKAREKSRRVFNQEIKLNIYSIKESNWMTDEVIDMLVEGLNTQDEQSQLRDLLEYLRDVFWDAKEFGSILNVKLVELDILEKRIEELKTENCDLLKMILKQEVLEKIPGILMQTKTLTSKFDVVCTNPPYMGSSGMGSKLNDYLRKAYPNTKSDMSTAFMEKGLLFCKPNGMLSMINIPVWMFISSYEQLREYLIREKTFVNMLHLGRGIFGADFGTTAFVIRNANIGNFLATYRKLYPRQGAVDSIEQKEKWFFEGVGCYYVNKEEFLKLPSTPIAYWSSKQAIENFLNKKFSDIAEARAGMITGDNLTFTRLWYEVSSTKVGFNHYTRESARESSGKWFPYNKGGGFRKWYGNNEYLVDWENDGYNLRNTKDENGKVPAHAFNFEYIFKKAITWSSVTSSKFSARSCDGGFLFDAGGSFARVDQKHDYILGFLNSKVAEYYLNLINPTLNFQKGNIESLPIIENPLVESVLEQIVAKNKEISKNDWDSFELSWDFIQHPLLQHKEKSSTIEDSYRRWEAYATQQFNQLKENEEEINRTFIEIYGLQEDLTPEVDEQDVTIQMANLEREIKSLISYAIGCLFGRYSIDEKGLIYAGGKLEQSCYKTFPIDSDNIIPVLSGTYFDDDIVSKFIEFIIVAFKKEDLLDNLDFVSKNLGVKNGETAKEAIRRYLLNDFFKDHVKTYKKRPIYWLFTSGKQKAFNCLIYMHRYDKSTLSRIRTDYLHELQVRMDAEKKTLLDIINGDGTTKEIANAKKELKSLDLKIEELRAYDEKLHHMADMQIEIDLDDGVAVNYAKFEGLLAPIK